MHRIVLETAIIYDLKQRAFRKIANLPDAIQSPAVCAHDNIVYAGGHKNIYKYEDLGDTDRWSTVLNTDFRPFCMVSFKGYIYVTQSFYNTVYRFRPNVDTKLSMFANFSWSPMAACNLGNTLLFFTSTNTIPNTLVAEEFMGTSVDNGPKVIWSGSSSDFTVNGVAGTCSVVMTMPTVNPGISQYHQRCLAVYDDSA